MTDLISRQAAIKAIDDLPNCYNGYSDTYDKAYIIGVLEELPTIEPFSTSGYVTTSTDEPPVVYAEQKHGEWEDVIDDDNEWICHKCSECGHEAYNYTGEILMNEWNFCPWCGAQMERREE